MSENPASLTLADIRRQPAVWQATAARAKEFFPTFNQLARDADEVIFMGAGCSYAVAQYAQASFQQHGGRPCRAATSMDFFQFPKWVSSVQARSLFVLFTRSGETTETLEAQRYARKLGAKILCVTSTEDAPIPKEAHEILYLPDTLEDAILPTVSTTSMMIAMQQLTFMLAEEEEVKHLLMGRIHQLLATNLEDQIEVGRRVGENEEIRRAAFLGSGPMLGAAYAASLMWQMATALPASHSPVFEYRHGPMEACGPDLLLSILISNAGRREDVALAREMKMRGPKVLANMTDPIPGMERMDYTDIVGEQLSDYVRGSLALPLYQSVAVHRALALGRDPDELGTHPPIITIDLSQYV
ncbi:MAG: SIS domain-containing protein [Armatimonadetes bacterium]|nr:SIS domain-containing protein [Armatimonadota bacterium]